MRKLKRFSLNENLFLFLLLFCILRFQIIAASHLYAFLLILILIIPIFLYLQKVCFFSKDGIQFLVFYISVASLSWYFSNNPSENNLLYYLLFYTLPILYYEATLSFLKKITVERILSIFDFIISVFKIYLFVEVIYRYYISYMTFKSQGLLSTIYNFKGNSFYSDTNFLALVIQNFATTCFYLYKKTKKKIYSKNYLLLMLFALFSLSRSVLITQIVLLLFDFYFSKFKKGQFVRFHFFTILGCIAVFASFFLLQEDASFRSKIVIFEGIKKIKDFDIANQIFGFGFGKGEFIYSYRKGDYGHLHIALLLGEEGIIGIVMFLLFLILTLKNSKGGTARLVFSFLISGFSLAFFDTSFYLCLGLITALNNKMTKKLAVSNLNFTSGGHIQ